MIVHEVRHKLYFLLRLRIKRGHLQSIADIKHGTAFVYNLDRVEHFHHFFSSSAKETGLSCQMRLFCVFVHWENQVSAVTMCRLCFNGQTSVQSV